MKTRIRETHYKNWTVTYMPQMKVSMFKWEDLSMYENWDKKYVENFMKEKVKKIEEENKRKDWWKIVKVLFLSK